MTSMLALNAFHPQSVTQTNSKRKRPYHVQLLCRVVGASTTIEHAPKRLLKHFARERVLQHCHTATALQQPALLQQTRLIQSAHEHVNHMSSLGRTHRQTIVIGTGGGQEWRIVLNKTKTQSTTTMVGGGGFNNKTNLADVVVRAHDVRHLIANHCAWSNSAWTTDKEHQTC
jgi:hypothetical protein